MGVNFRFTSHGPRFYTPRTMARRRKFDDVDAEDAFDPLPPRRPGTRKTRRPWAVFSLAALAVLAAMGWMAPTVVVLTPLRDRPLEAVLAGIDGSVASGSAHWHWLGSVSFHDVVIRDRAGRAVAVVPSLVLDRGLLGLATDPGDLGTVRLTGPEVLVEVRPGGSSLEDMFAPWLAARAVGSVARPAFELELVDAAVEVVDRHRRDAWRLADIMAAITLPRGGGVAGWTVAGRAHHAGGGLEPPSAPATRPTVQGIDRTTIAAKATAALARDGGWSIASPAAAAWPRSVTLAAHRLPLGLSSVLATRFDTLHLLDGLADVRVDLTIDDLRRPAGRVQGSLVVDQLALCRSDTLAEVATLGRCELPLDVALIDGRLEIGRLIAQAPRFRAEASGRIAWPTGSVWKWLESLIADDFTIGVDLDLAAAARELPGGITVRPDLRLTDGRLELAAVARGDGADRVLELRMAARDLGGLRRERPGGPDTEAVDRPVRWPAPVSAWVHGRLPPGRDAILRIDEARITSEAMELSASGTVVDGTLQWTTDLARLSAAVAEVLDLEGVVLAGTSRGRIDLETGGDADTSVLRAAVGLSDSQLRSPGRPAWRETDLRLELDTVARRIGGAVVVERATANVASADDRMEATLVGGAVVDLAALLWGGPTSSWLRPGPQTGGMAAEAVLSGDLSRWHARLAALLPPAHTGLEVGGRIRGTAAVAARGPAWQITKADGEVEKFTLKLGDRSITEPRLIATMSGMVHPESGQVDVSSAEVLTPTLSLRTGGLSWQPGGPPTLGMAGSLRGRLQWQADVARLIRWLVPEAIAEVWPATGRTWGTLELVETPAGFNALLETAGSQLALATRLGQPRGSAPRNLWSEPEASLVVEFTQPRSVAGRPDDQLRIERLAFDSSTLALSAGGVIGPAEARRMVELGGNVDFRWEQLSRLLTPWTAGTLRAVGSGGRPFTLRGPLLPPLPAPAEELTPDMAALPLPESWLAATRGRDPAADRSARPTRSVVVSARRTPTLADRFRDVSFDTSIAWQAAEIAGFPLSAGEMPLRLVEGQLALGPFDVAAAGGRLRGSPWLSLVSDPWELVLPPGRVVDRVAMSEVQGRRWLAWLSPLLARSTRAEGMVSVDFAGGRVPWNEPLAGTVAAQVLLENLEVTPAAELQPLVTLLVRLQAALDPRFAVGDKAVLLRVRPEPIRVRLAEGRLWHEGLVMDSGQLTVRSAGSVGRDGGLSMVVEVALRGDVAAGVPVIAQLLQTPLAIPLGGTLDRPRFDARAIDVVLARVVENTAQAVLRDGLGRGLETLFGNPPPPPGPLTLPPAP
jgi:translocation and assembly module TamB